MEHNLIISAITERIDMGSRNYGKRTSIIPVTEMAEGSVWIAYECDGQVNPNNPDDTVHLEWLITIDKLDADHLEFTFEGKQYTLNRHWQVLGTMSYGLPNPYISESARFIFYFATDQGEENDYSKLLKIREIMAKNYDEGHLWMNIPFAREALHLMKERGASIDRDKAKAFCEEVLEAPYIDEKDTPRLFLSYLDYFHCLWNSTYYEDSCTYHLLQTIDHEMTDEKFIEMTKSYRSLLFDPIQRTPQWENVIYDVERECHEILKDEPRHMGFCHRYWSVKREVLAKRGIEWKSPQAMNPRVRFD